MNGTRGSFFDFQEAAIDSNSEFGEFPEVGRRLAEVEMLTDVEAMSAKTANDQTHH